MTGRVTIYTCVMGNYDWVHQPVRPTPGAEFIRFADRAKRGQSPWQHRPAPDHPMARSNRLVCRYAKTMAYQRLPESTVSVWVDSNVLILDDLTPLIHEFMETGADIALFRHPSGRNIAEELDFALKVGRVSAAHRASAQRDRYRTAGLLDQPVHETTILFRRNESETLHRVMARWWDEISTYTERDQVSLPFSMQGEGCRVHEWDWHFDDPGCRWFRRVPHRPSDWRRRMLTGETFLADYRSDYRLLRSAMRPARWLRQRFGDIIGARGQAR